MAIIIQGEPAYRIMRRMIARGWASLPAPVKAAQEQEHLYLERKAASKEKERKRRRIWMREFRRKEKQKKFVSAMQEFVKIKEIIEKTEPAPESLKALLGHRAKLLRIIRRSNESIKGLSL